MESSRELIIKMPAKKSPQRPKSISDLFKFLSQQHQTNVDVQHGFLAEALSPPSVEDRAVLLMHKVLGTQTQPKLDHICKFFKKLTDKHAHKSFEDFRRFVTGDGEFDLVEGLRNQPGWGDKTAALFVKNLGYIEMEPSLRKRFWKDTDVVTGDQLRLPVDRVIETVFQAMTDAGRLPEAPKPNFTGINRYLRELEYCDHDMLVWDDLWFWGFISQRTVGTERTHEWNESKYWAIPHALKDAQSISKIKANSERFRGLVC